MWALSTIPFFSLSINSMEYIILYETILQTSDLLAFKFLVVPIAAEFVKKEYHYKPTSLEGRVPP